jgi:glucose-1-phosphate thymidylyltransferase
MDKAVILAAGRGTRMQRAQGSAALDASQTAAAQSGEKAMMPVGRPFIDYVLSGMADVGYRRVCVVIGPAHASMRSHVCGVSGVRLSVEVAIQPEPLGTASAVLAAARFAADDPFLLINGDNYYPASALGGLRSLLGPGVAAFRPAGLCRGNIAAERLPQYAVLSGNSKGYLDRIIEKPGEQYFADHADSILVSMNCWRLTPAIFEACQKIPRSPRGEYELPDAVAYAIKHLGERFEVLVVDEPVLDLSTRADVAEVTRRLATVEVRL